MEGRSHSWREKFQSRNSRVGDRRSRARSFNADHYPLWRRWPLRPGRRKFAANGLQERAINGRRLQSLEGRSLTCDKITRAWWHFELTAEANSESKLSTNGLVMAEAPLPHELGEDRKSTRLNSSHTVISYAVFCLKKKKQQ